MRALLRSMGALTIGWGAGAGGAAVLAGCFAFEVCDDLPDEVPSDAEVELVVQNDRAVPVFIEFSDEDCETAEAFALTRGGSAVQWRRPLCGFSCEAVRSAACDCADDCGGPTVLRLEPGASYSVNWDTSVYVAHEVSVDCAEEGCPLTCHQQTVASEGSYSASVVVAEQCAGACDCADGQESCFVSGTLEGPTFEAEESFSLPNADSVVVSVR